MCWEFGAQAKAKVTWAEFGFNIHHLFNTKALSYFYPQVNMCGWFWTVQWMPSGLRISTLSWTTTRPWPWLMEIVFPWLLTVRSSLNHTTLTTLPQPRCLGTEWFTWALQGSTGNLFFRYIDHLFHNLYRLHTVFCSREQWTYGPT